jgi:hypothetical protein
MREYLTLWKRFLHVPILIGKTNISTTFFSCQGENLDKRAFILSYYWIKFFLNIDASLTEFQSEWEGHAIRKGVLPYRRYSIR